MGRPAVRSQGATRWSASLPSGARGRHIRGHRGRRDEQTEQWAAAGGGRRGAVDSRSTVPGRAGRALPAASRHVGTDGIDGISVRWVHVSGKKHGGTELWEYSKIGGDIRSPRRLYLSHLRLTSGPAALSLSLSSLYFSRWALI